MALPQTINPASPAGTDSPALGDDQIRDLKLALIDIFGIPNNTAVTAAAFSITAAGVVTVSQTGLTATDLIITRGTITTSAFVLDSTVTWNSGATTFTAWRLRVTNTASNAASLLVDLQVGGTTQFSVNRSGALTALGAVTCATLGLTAATNQIVLDSDGASTGTITMEALGANRVWTLPDATATLVGTDITQTLSNKTYASPVFTGAGSVANAWTFTATGATVPITLNNTTTGIELQGSDSGANPIMLFYKTSTPMHIFSSVAGRLSLNRDASTGGLQIFDTNNLKIAGISLRATTEGSNHLDIFDGTAPVGTLANGISLYSAAGELNVMDAGGTATPLSPHRASILNNYQDPTDPFPWIYAHRNPYLGVEQEVVMSAVIREVERLSGKTFLTTRMLPQKLNWDEDQEKLRLGQESEISRVSDRLNDLDQAIAQEQNSTRKGRLMRERDSIKVPAPYVKQRPPKWMADRGVTSAI